MEDFDEPYKPSNEAIDLVNRVLDFIEANPEKWNQENYGHATSEKNCFFGMLIRISGIDPYSDEYLNHGYTVWPGMKLLKLPYDRAYHISYWLSRHHDDTSPKRVAQLRERVSVALNYNFRKSNNVITTSTD